MSTYFPPKADEPQFNCPFCGVNASQFWRGLDSVDAKDCNVRLNDVRVCFCGHCQRHSVWLNSTMLHPSTGTASFPHDEMPEDVKVDFDEARAIASRSPRGAAGLLRLAIQKLMVDLGESGKHIDTDIKNLVAKGLDPMIQQALDAVRVIGNEAVHPGTLDLNDTPELAHSLFDLVNLVVDERIAKPKRVRAIYDKLPPGKIKAIADRDK